jgi:hypothetical protein
MSLSERTGAATSRLLTSTKCTRVSISAYTWIWAQSEEHSSSIVLNCELILVIDSGRAIILSLANNCCTIISILKIYHASTNLMFSYWIEVGNSTIDSTESNRE